MDHRRIRKPLTTFMRKIPQSITVDQVIVFGSQGEGKATKESDIDVLVISDDFIPLTEDQRLDILHHAAEGIEPVIDPWGFTKRELQAADTLTTLGHARTTGVRFL